jgi:hypothetical protein
MNKVDNTRQRNFVVGLIVIGLLIIGFFGLRTFRTFREFRAHRPPPPLAPGLVETDVELIRDWMTIPYISISYRLPPNLLYESLKIPPQENEKKSLKQLGSQYYPQDPHIVLEKVKTAILAYQVRQPAVPSSTLLPTGNP